MVRPGSRFCRRRGFFLPKLADQLCLRLPEAGSVDFDPHVPPVLDFPDTQVASTLRDLGPVSLDLVSDTEDRRRWEAMVATHHPEGWRRPPGGQLRHWVSTECHGVLGGVGFTAAEMQLGPRDSAIGWSADARLANIGRVVHNNRLLLLPGVRVYGLVSFSVPGEYSPKVPK